MHIHMGTQKLESKERKYVLITVFSFNFIKLSHPGKAAYLGRKGYGRGTILYLTLGQEVKLGSVH